MVGEEPARDTARNAYWKDLAEVSEKFGAQVRHFDDSYWHLWILGRSVSCAIATHSPKNKFGSKWERLAYANYNDDRGEGILGVIYPTHRLRIGLIAEQMKGRGYEMVLRI